MEENIFYEEQKFDQKWLRILIFVSFVAFILLFFFVKNGYIIGGLIGIPIVVLILLLKLKTIITAEGITVRFFPLYVFDKTLPWSSIASLHVRKYRPLTEYGGWGVRFSQKYGLAFTTKGRNGLQIELKNGKKLLIGTQKSEKLKEILPLLYKLRDDNTE